MIRRLKKEINQEVKQAISGSKSSGSWRSQLKYCNLRLKVEDLSWVRIAKKVNWAKAQPNVQDFMVVQSWWAYGPESLVMVQGIQRNKFHLNWSLQKWMKVHSRYNRMLRKKHTPDNQFGVHLVALCEDTIQTRILDGLGRRIMSTEKSKDKWQKLGLGGSIEINWLDGQARRSCVCVLGNLVKGVDCWSWLWFCDQETILWSSEYEHQKNWHVMPTSHWRC